MRIIIVDDHVLFRQALANILQNQTDMTLVGQAGSVSEAIPKIFNEKPDLVLMDLMLPDGDAFEAMKTILAELPETRIIILSGHESTEMLVHAFLFGAKGYLLKSISSAMLLASLRGVGRGEVGLSRGMTGQVLEEFSKLLAAKNRPQASLADLSPRELDVLKVLASGATNRKIAERMFITENTVKIHLRNINKKLNLRNRKEAIQLARKIGLVNGDDPAGSKSQMDR